MPQTRHSVKRSAALSFLPPVAQSFGVMTQGELLRQAIDEAGISVAALARRLAEENGHDAEDVRGYIYRWFRGGGISDPWAERLAATLDREPDYFKKREPAPDELERLRSLAASLLREVEELQRRLAES